MSRRVKLLAVVLLVLGIVLAGPAAWSRYTAWRLSRRDATRDVTAALARGDFRLLQGTGRVGSPGVSATVAARAMARCGARSVPIGDVVPRPAGEQAWYAYASAYNAALQRSVSWSDRCMSPSDAAASARPDGT